MPSIVDPAFQWGGAWTATRGIVNLLQAPPFDAEVISVATVSLSWPARRARRYLALAQSLVSGLPAKFQFQHSRQMIDRVRSLLRDQNFNLILLNGSDLLWMLPHLPRGPAKLLLAHNIEHLLYADQIHLQCPRPSLQKAMLLKDHARLRQQELTGLRTVGNVVFLSTEDEAYARQECPQLNAISVPPLVDGICGARPASPGRASGIEIGMLANFEWWPSQQGLRWFLREVFPNLHSGVRLHLFGKRSEGVATDDLRVVKHGYVPQLDDVWSTCHFMICPVFAGGGVSIKLADPVSRGIPVVGTRHAVRGLPIDSDPAIVLRETAGEWIEFLNSYAARGLGNLSPSPQIMAQFRQDTHVDRVSRFLSTVLPGLPAAPAEATCTECEC